MARIHRRTDSHSSLTTEEGFLISPCYSLELCIQMLISPFLLCFSLLFFSQLFLRPPFYEDLQDLLELTPKKDVLFIIEDWNAKVGSQETPGVTGKFGPGIWNEAGQRLLEFCQENALVIANTLFQQHERRLYTWTSPDGQH